MRIARKWVIRSAQVHLGSALFIAFLAFMRYIPLEVMPFAYLVGLFDCVITWILSDILRSDPPDYRPQGITDHTVEGD